MDASSQLNKAANEVCDKELQTSDAVAGKRWPRWIPMEMPFCPMSFQQEYQRWQFLLSIKPHASADHICDILLEYRDVNVNHHHCHRTGGEDCRRLVQFLAGRMHSKVAKDADAG